MGASLSTGSPQEATLDLALPIGYLGFHQADLGISSLHKPLNLSCQDLSLHTVSLESPPPAPQEQNAQMGQGARESGQLCSVPFPGLSIGEGPMGTVHTPQAPTYAAPLPLGWSRRPAGARGGRRQTTDTDVTSNTQGATTSCACSGLCPGQAGPLRLRQYPISALVGGKRTHQSRAV